MEVNNRQDIVPLYSPEEMDREEGQVISALINSASQPIPDPDRWLEEELQRSVLITKLDTVFNWARMLHLGDVFSTFPAI